MVFHLNKQLYIINVSITVNIKITLAFQINEKHEKSIPFIDRSSLIPLSKLMRSEPGPYG
jgi:hypothetical protein